jgi:hypothetical protein
LSIGVDATSYIPTLYNGEKYIAEGFLTKSGLLLESFNSRLLETENKQSSGLLCLDACVVPTLQSILDGSDFTLQQIYKQGKLNNNNRHFTTSFEDSEIPKDIYYKAQSIYISSDVPSVVVNDYCFSTKVGAEEDVKQFGFFGKRDYDKSARNYVRGIYCPFIGTNANLQDNALYNIRQKGYSDSYMKDYFKVRGNDLTGFYAISDRYSLEELDIKQLDIYRGDCYTNTVTFRLNRNFVDSSVPINDIIINSRT